MKGHSKAFARVVVGGLAALAFVLSASRVARSTTTVHRTVTNCTVVTSKSPDVMEFPGWTCGLQAGSDNNGMPISGQLTSTFFDYWVDNVSPVPTIQVCIWKTSYTGTGYSDCVRPSPPTTLPATVDQFVQPINVKQNPSVYDYVGASFTVYTPEVYPDYTPVRVGLMGVVFTTSY